MNEQLAAQLGAERDFLRGLQNTLAFNFLTHQFKRLIK